MSPAQTALYFREWGKVRAHYIAKGIDPKQAENKRHELHKKALGTDKSSKSFTNADLDRVLAAFYAITRPADLTAQLRQIDQPELRRQECWIRILDILIELRVGNKYAYDEDDLLARRVAYVDGLVGKVIKGQQRWDQLDDKQARVLLGIMQRRLLAVRQAAAKHEAPAAAHKMPDNFPW